MNSTQRKWTADMNYEQLLSLSQLCEEQPDELFGDELFGGSEFKDLLAKRRGEKFKLLEGEICDFVTRLMDAGFPVIDIVDFMKGEANELADLLAEGPLGYHPSFALISLRKTETEGS